MALGRGNAGPRYDRLHVLFRLVVRYHLMYRCVVYGAMKVFCARFPPISGGRVEATYGQSSPMGLLCRRVRMELRRARPDERNRLLKSRGFR